MTALLGGHSGFDWAVRGLWRRRMSLRALVGAKQQAQPCKCPSPRMNPGAPATCHNSLPTRLSRTTVPVREPAYGPPARGPGIASTTPPPLTIKSVTLLPSKVLSKLYHYLHKASEITLLFVIQGQPNGVGIISIDRESLLLRTQNKFGRT